LIFSSLEKLATGQIAAAFFLIVVVFVFANATRNLPVLTLASKSHRQGLSSTCEVFVNSFAAHAKRYKCLKIPQGYRGHDALQHDARSAEDIAISCCANYSAACLRTAR
jgi:hypothetical protein